MDLFRGSMRILRDYIWYGIRWEAQINFVNASIPEMSLSNVIKSDCDGVDGTEAFDRSIRLPEEGEI